MAATSSNVGAIANQPDNTNYLSPIGFNFSIQKIPHANYFLQSANLPSVQLGDLETPSPFVSIPQIGDHLRYGDLFITFKVDEDMKNYLEIYNWIMSLGYPDSIGQTSNKEVRSYSDATLQILNSNFNPNGQITFKGAFPVSLSGLEFNAANTDVEYFTAQAVFKYQIYKITDNKGKTH